MEVSANDTYIIYIGDNKPVIDSIHKGKAHCSKHIYKDLFDMLFEYIEKKNIRLQVLWMPSHLDDPNSKNLGRNMLQIMIFFTINMQMSWLIWLRPMPVCRIILPTKSKTIPSL